MSIYRDCHMQLGSSARILRLKSARELIMKLVPTLVTAAIVMTSPALAADLIIDEPSFISPLSAYEWSGFYVGLNGGYAWGNGDQDITVDALGFLVPPSAQVGISGGLLTGSLGANYQMDEFVVGVEGELGWANISGMTIQSGDDGYRTSVDWLGNLRGRLGYAVDSFMVYGTGGVAVAGIGIENGDVDGTAFDPVTGTATTSLTGFGYVVGAGVEVAVMDNVSVKAEYNYYDFGTMAFTAPTSTAVGTEEGTVTTNFHAVKVGVNYAF